MLLFLNRLNAICFENTGKEDLLLKQGQVFAVESQVINIFSKQSSKVVMLGKAKYARKCTYINLFLKTKFYILGLLCFFNWWCPLELCL